MAWTTTKKEFTVHGADRVVIMSCTADAATQSVNTDLTEIYGYSFSPYSMATANTVVISINNGAEGTALAGYLGCSGFANNDQFCFVVYGR